MASVPGLRERKKQQTRQQIFDAASRLFEAKGFDRVSVAEIARAADVSEVTVFNYFPTKEDLFYGGMEFFEEQLIESVRSRPKGEPAVKAFRRRSRAGAAPGSPRTTGHRRGERSPGSTAAWATTPSNASGRL